MNRFTVLVNGRLSLHKQSIIHTRQRLNQFWIVREVKGLWQWNFRLNNLDYLQIVIARRWRTIQIEIVDPKPIHMLRPARAKSSHSISIQRIAFQSQLIQNPTNSKDIVENQAICHEVIVISSSGDRL